MKVLFSLSALLMLTLSLGTGRGAELPPADFLVGRAAVPPPDFLAVRDSTPPRPQGEGWTWDATRRLWWRWAPPAAARPAYTPVTFGVSFSLGQPLNAAACGPNGCPPASGRFFLRR
jgi:hypothetical protein